MKFIERKMSWKLTKTGWLLICLIIILSLSLVMGRIHAFLAVSHPIKTGIQVVEGWVPDYVLEKAASDFKKNSYSYLLTTGGPLDKGHLLIDFKTHAQVAAATLKKLKFNSQRLIVVPAPPVRKDRTYASALAVSQWIAGNNEVGNKNVTVYTLGTHARRTWMLYKKALGEDYNIGIVAVADENYPAAQWWQSSAGVRKVINEAIAYAYARFLF